LDFPLQLFLLKDTGRVSANEMKSNSWQFCLIFSLIINLELESEGLMCQEISNISVELLAYGKKILPARRKRITHFDRDHQISGTVLGATTEKKLEAFLENIQRYCDTVGRAIGLGPLDFTSSNGSGDVRDLLKILRDYYKNA
jgi:hypothetical protein